MRRVATEGLLVLAAVMGAVGAPGHARSVDPPYQDVSHHPEIRRSELPLFSCGGDQILAYPIPVTWQQLALAIDGRLYVPCFEGTHSSDHRERRESRLISRATTAPDLGLRRLAALGRGRLGGMPRQVSLSDELPVRLAAIAGVAIGAAVRSPVLEDETAAARTHAARVSQARLLLERQLGMEVVPLAIGAVLEALGSLPYGSDPERAEVERLLMKYGTEDPDQRYGLVKGLAALIRANPRRQIAAETRAYLRRMTTAGSPLFVVPTVAGENTAPAPGSEEVTGSSSSISSISRGSTASTRCSGASSPVITCSTRSWKAPSS